MAESNEEQKKEDYSKEIEFYLEYIRSTRKTWIDQDLKRNQEHAFLGLSSEVGELTDAYKKVIGYGKKLDTTNVLEEIGDISYFLARVLDELFYKHEEPFSRVDSKTVFDDLVVDIASLIREPQPLEEEIDNVDLILALPCYYKDIYIGASNKDTRSFMIGVLSLVGNLVHLSVRLESSYDKILIANIKKLHERTKKKGIKDKEKRDTKKEAKVVEDGTK
jgi:NTP pyrophosphatase (non-canonical NTP hydrolase)